MSMKMTMAEFVCLEPCPFCGGKARHYAPGPIDHHIECVECYADIHRDTEAEAIAAWNSRAAMEFDNWFYLPKPKEPIVEVTGTMHAWDGTKVKTDVFYQVQEQAVINWAKELDERIIKRICEVWNSRADYHGYEQAAIEAWESIKAWNSRAERTCEFNIKDNMNETEGMGDVWIECSACNCVFDFYADEWLMKMSYCPNCGCKVVS